MDQFREAFHKDDLSESTDFQDYRGEAFAKPSAISSKRLTLVEGSRVDQESELLKKEFTRLSKRWKADTAFLSSSHARYFHPSYQRVIGMGKEALPLILDDLRAGQSDWFWAPRCITGSDPVRKADWGDFAKAKAAWLNWEKKQRG